MIIKILGTGCRKCQMLEGKRLHDAGLQFPAWSYI